MTTPSQTRSPIADMPTDPADWPSWLERELVGLDLGPLVAELSLVQNPEGKANSDSVSLESLLGDDLERVLRQGLASLPPAKLAALLKRPTMLLVLQERIVVDGGAHWRSVPRTDRHREAAQKGWQRLQAAIDETMVEPKPKPKPPPQGLIARSWMLWGSAAALLLAVVGWWYQTPRGIGFDRPGLMTARVDAAEHLKQLAEAAADYTMESRLDRQRLRQRITAFRKGCDTLLAAKHEQLVTNDADWLRERCRAWAEKLDGHLADLDAGKPLEDIRAAAEETRTKMVTALKTRLAA